MNFRRICFVLICVCLFNISFGKAVKTPKKDKFKSEEPEPDQIPKSGEEGSSEIILKLLDKISKLKNKLHPDDGDDLKRNAETIQSSASHSANKPDAMQEPSQISLESRQIADDEKLMQRIKNLDDKKMIRSMTEEELVHTIKYDVERSRKHRLAAKELVQNEVDEQQNISKRGVYATWPRNYGMNLDDHFGKSHPAKDGLRKEDATNTHTCHSVRSIPSSFRNRAFFPVHSFYKQYTEAYGILVLGSATVKKESLQRTCYILYMMLADRYDVRNMFYKNYGTLALIADDEVLTSLPEYSHLDPAINKRSRGLGGTLTKPLICAGDDNQRCAPGDPYYDQDVMIHEICHGIHHLAAQYVVENFVEKIMNAFRKNVNGKGKWLGTYADTNVFEYFAVGCQFYFESFRGNSYEDVYHIPVRDRASLAAYDPDLTSILDEIFPCASYYSSNVLVQRCEWKYCDYSLTWKLKFGSNYNCRSDCDVLKKTKGLTAQECGELACFYGGNAFQIEGSTCEVLTCDSYAVSKTDGLKINQGSSYYDIYILNDGASLPSMDLPELDVNPKEYCTQGPTSSECSIPIADREYPNVEITSKSFCKRCGFCWDSGDTTSKCYYSKQKCSNTDLKCADVTDLGHCETNPHFMNVYCPLACNKCSAINNIDPVEEDKKCQDRDFYCYNWADNGQCDSNPYWMAKNCAISCNECTP